MVPGTKAIIPLWDTQLADGIVSNGTNIVVERTIESNWCNLPPRGFEIASACTQSCGRRKVIDFQRSRMDNSVLPLQELCCRADADIDAIDSNFNAVDWKIGFTPNWQNGMTRSHSLGVEINAKRTTNAYTTHTHTHTHANFGGNFRKTVLESNALTCYVPTGVAYRWRRRRVSVVPPASS